MVSSARIWDISHDGMNGVVSIDARRLITLLVFLGIGSIPAAAGLDTVGRIAALFPLAESPHPYMVTTHGVLLYVWSPLVVASACLVMLAPGLCLALTAATSLNVTRWILSGFALTLTLLPVVTPAVEAMTGSLRGERFLLLLGCATLAAWSWTFARVVRGRSLHWPMAEPGARTTLVAMVLVPVGLLLALTPKFYWDNFNGDGVHAFEAARLLLSQKLPFFPESAGGISSFPGMSSLLFTFPSSWFIRLFGPVEASIRLSVLLYLPVLFGGVVALAEHDRVRPLSVIERWIVWLPLVVYVIALGYSATYNPYSADLALPATQDTLQMVCVIGAILAFVRRERPWLILFTAFSCMASPNGSMLLGLWLMSVWVAWRPRPTSDLRFAFGALVACVVASAVVPLVLAALHLPVPGREYALKNFLERFAFLQWWDWRRVLFAVVPCGIIPLAAVVHWRSQDRVARALTLLVAAYFCFFYVQAYTALHYYIPAMLLPIVIFWRNRLTIDAAPRGVMPALTIACGLVALAVSLPRNPSPHTIARRIGATIEARDDGYDNAAAVSIHRSEVLAHLFKYDWDPEVPQQAYGGAPVVWNYYAHQTKPEPRTIRYVILAAGQAAPVGMTLLAREVDADLYESDPSATARDRRISAPSPAGSRTYFIPRSMIFHSIPPDPGQRPIIQVVEILKRWGVSTDAILQWFDVKP